MIEILFKGPFGISKRSVRLYDSLSGQKVLRVVEGSRCFESPGDFGMMHYQGCQVTVFEGTADAAWKALEEAMRGQPHERARIAGSDVLVVPDVPEKGWTLHLAHAAAKRHSLRN